MTTKVTLRDKDHHWIRGKILRRGPRILIMKGVNGSIFRIPRSQILFEEKEA